MEDRKGFGVRLRELRTEAGLTLSKLADRCNIDFTYLSKIEISALPPPSEKVILQLAAALNADKDELLILAGKIPSDIAEILKSRQALELFRSGRFKKTGGQISQSFGQRLRELRQQLGLTLKELEARVDINYTYISKIENGILPPPSEKVVIQLTEALHADREELLLLAGILPPDIIEKLKDPKFLKTLRSRIEKDATRKAEKPRFSLPGVSMPNIRVPVMALSFKPLYRVAMPILLVIAIAASLWYASPAQALEIDFQVPTSGTLGGTYTFTTTVTINQNDLIPIQSINLEIYNVADPTKIATLENLPLGNSTLQAHTIKEGASSGSAMVSAAVTAGWTSGYAYGTGYAYWINQGYSFGYGYGYGYGGGITSVTYTVHWVSPASWPAGTYQIDAKVTASDPLLTKTFTESSNTFTLYSYTPPPAGPGTTSPTTTPPTNTPAPGTIDVSDVVTDDGVFTQDLTAASDDGNVEIAIPEDTVGLTEDGQPLSEITIVTADAPTGASTISVLGQIYDLGPDGATFDPAITLTFHFDTDDVPEGEVPVINRWDPDANGGEGAWVEITGGVIDMENGTITVEIDHFTIFAVLHVAAPTPPTTTPPTTTPPTTTPPTTTPPTTTPPTTAPPTTAPPTTTPPTTGGATNWWLIGGIIAAVIIIGAITAIMIIRYRRKS
jgi:transcriptional regulator with XRE-family HTH domain